MDNVTFKNQYHDGADDSESECDINDIQEDSGTNENQEDDGNHDSQDECDINESQKDYATDDSAENVANEEIQGWWDIKDSPEDDGTDVSQEDDGLDDGHKGSCNMKHVAALFCATHETQVSEGGEADLHKHFKSCEKNPGHTNFVPVNDFNISHLPEGHHDNDLVELIKAIADLTVRVAVKMTSTERPELLPNTTVPYAFYNIRGSDVMRIGTGMIWCVNKWTEENNKVTCRCHKCQHSDTPSKVWGDVMMRTARHVVFDDVEARHTTCRLFFDGQDSPLVTLDGWMVHEANTEDDSCLVKHVTCDLNLLNKLDKMMYHWLDLCRKVNNKYESSRDKDKLTFIVSHPHGCPKMVSVGQLIKKCKVRGFMHMTKNTYTTCTCPGSSGALVHELGYIWCYDLHVHSGVNSEGQNYSATGRDWP